LKSPAKKETVPLEHRSGQLKTRIVGGKRSGRPENQNVSRIFGFRAENSNVQLKI
jgi:hypothetical protein